MPTQDERRASTRNALLRAGRQLFGTRGFAATTVDDLGTAAGVAKGGFYHHFQSKEDLFTAVLEAQQAELVTEVIAAAAKGEGAIDALKRGCRAFLVACLKPSVRRIVLLDGPAVIGWHAWREIDARYFGGLIRQGLEAAVAEGVVEARRVDALVSVLLGAVTEAAMVSARTTDASAKQAVAVLMAEIGELLDGLTLRRRPRSRRE